MGADFNLRGQTKFLIYLIKSSFCFTSSPSELFLV